MIFLIYKRDTSTTKENCYQYPLVKCKLKHESTLEIQNVVKWFVC